jgi:rhodanese-related sulfurtransferase
VNVPEIEPGQLAAQLRGPEARRPVLLDVRTAEEHGIASLPESRWIPLHELQARADELEDLRGREVVVYCHHGQRSLAGAAFLRHLGIDACSLAGGIDRYSAAVDPAVPRY